MERTDRITADIDRRLGFVPAFFAPALDAPEVLEALWHQTLASYLDNPLPAHLKERLFAYLSRLCGNGYCLVCHCCVLRELGASGGEVLELLQTCLSDDPLEAALLLDGTAPLDRWPVGGSRGEDRLVALAAHVFVADANAGPCLAELRRLLGSQDFARLVLLLSYIAACHDWVLAHPEISHEDDERVLRHLPALVREEPHLAELLHGQGRASAPARRDHLAAIVESAGDAIIGETLDGTIVSWNRAAQRLFGYSAEMVLGHSTAMLVPEEHLDEASAIMLRVHGGESVDPLDTVRVGADGRRVDVAMTVSPVHSASGAVVGAASIARDVRERKRRERCQQALAQVTRLLAQSRPEAQTLATVLRVVGASMQWSVSAVWVPTRHSHPVQLRCAAFWRDADFEGKAFELASRQLRLDFGEGIPGRVWEMGQARWVADVGREPHSRRSAEAQRDDLHTCYLVPVHGRDSVLAVIEFLSDEIRPPDPMVLEVVNRLSGRIGEFLERKRAEELLVGGHA